LVTSKIEPLARKKSSEELTHIKKNEGLNILYKIGGYLWVVTNSSKTLKKLETLKLIKKGLNIYQDQMKYDLEFQDCMKYKQLIEKGFLKKKHWIYAEYMAALSSIPIFGKLGNKDILLESILAKTALGTSTKLLDNLNDSIQSVDSALLALQKFNQSLIDPNFKNLSIFQNHSEENLAVNSANVIANMVPKSLLRCNAPQMFRIFMDDVNKLIEGQAESIKFRSQNNDNKRTIRDYLRSISEKSIGDVWIDIDLCFLENELRHIGIDDARSLEMVKKGCSLVYKSSLIYDDAQDLSVDIADGAINSAILLALESGRLNRQDLIQQSPKKVEKDLYEKGVIFETLKLADLIFLKGMHMIDKASEHSENLIDWKGLDKSLRFVRLFNLRKIMMMKKKYRIFKLLISSFGDLKRIDSDIPDSICYLERYA
jgi:hypothetical protein